MRGDALSSASRRCPRAKPNYAIMFLVGFPQDSHQHAARQTVRVAALMMLLCVFVFGQSAALTSEHHQHHASDHCCVLCHAGPQPLLQSTVSSRFTPVFETVWLTPAAETATAPRTLLKAKTSRAPPAS
jgi:hypothetical protein